MKKPAKELFATAFSISIALACRNAFGGSNAAAVPPPEFADGESSAVCSIPQVEGNGYKFEFLLEFENTGANECEVAFCREDDPYCSDFVFGIDSGHVFVRGMDLRSLEKDDAVLPAGTVSLRLEASVSIDGSIGNRRSNGGELLSSAFSCADFTVWRSFKIISRGCAVQPSASVAKRPDGLAIHVVCNTAECLTGEDAESSR